MKRLVLVGVGMLIVVAVITVAATSQFMLSALPEPGKMETYLAIKVKHYLVHRGSRERHSACSHWPAGEHQGRRQTLRYGLRRMPWGEWAQPHGCRAVDVSASCRSDLRRRSVLFRSGNLLDRQEWNPAECMPAFGKVESDDHIWDLALFIRSLGQPSSRRE